MVRKTLKSLQSEIVILTESISEQSTSIYDMRRENESLKSEVSNLKRDLENCQSEKRKHCDILTTIVKILSGKSQLASKAAVIEDLLIIEVDREKEHMKIIKNDPYQNGGVF